MIQLLIEGILPKGPYLPCISMAVGHFGRIPSKYSYAYKENVAITALLNVLF